MKIEENSVVRFHYTVSESGQGQLESSRDIEPLSILIGHGNIIPGLESAMKGHEAGDTLRSHGRPRTRPMASAARAWCSACRASTSRARS